MKRVLYIVGIALICMGRFSPALAVTTTPTILPYEGVLKDASAVPVITAQDFRFSIWNDSDYDAPADFDGSGNIPGGAPGFSGYSEVQTVTPDSSGFFQINIGSFNPIPDFNTTTYLYLQVEIKPNGSPDTSYEILDIDGTVNATDRQAFGTVPYSSNSDFLDNAELGTSAGDIAVLGLGGVFSESFIPGGTNQNDFTLDSDNSGGDITLQFGTTLNETLTWDNTNSEFDLSDDLNVSGNVIVSGTTNTSGITSTGTVNFSGSTTFRIREVANEATATCTNVGELVLDSTENRIYVCTAVGAPGTWVAAAPDQDLDSVYTTDTDKTLAVNNASGLTFNSSSAGNILFNLQNTGDLVVQDNGTNFALFSDTGLFELSGLENTERLRLSDTTNADSVGLYVGTGTPDAVINAQSGSAYFDELGVLYINNSVGSGTTWNRVELEKGRVVRVAKSGAQFTSIKAAVDSITDASSIKPYVVQVSPGVYVEAAITLPSFVSIMGQGTVTIVAASPTSTLIDAATSTRVDTVILSGAAGPGGICYRATSVSLLSNVQFASCETGILATGAGTSLQILSAGAVSGPFTNFLSAVSGAIINASTVAIRTTSAVTRGLNVVGAGTNVEISTYAILTNSVVDGVYLDSSATINLYNTTIRNTVNGIHVGPSGASTLRGSGGIVENSSQYTLYVEAASTAVYFAGLQTQKEKFNIHPGALISISFNNTTSGEEGLNVFGHFSVGSPEHPNSTYLGQGDPYTNGMLVYTFDGVSYTDVTSAASNPVGTPFSFPAVTTGNAIYISSDRESDGDFIQFTGFHYSTTSTVANLGAGSVVHEYWNGSAWTDFTTNCVHGSLGYTYDQQCFLRPDSAEHDNFELDIRGDWTKNDPPSLGTNRYWVRLRISSDIVVAPVFEHFMLHPDSIKVNSNGDIEFLGDSRFHRSLISGLNIFTSRGSNSPQNTSFVIGPSGTMIRDLQHGSFRGDTIQLDELSGSLTIPVGIDTSSKLDTIIYWKKTDNNAGNVQWKIDYSVAGVENVHIVDGSNIATAPRSIGDDVANSTVQTIETIPDGNANTSNQVIASSFSPEIDISHFYEGDELFLRLYRDASDPDDTYTGQAAVVAFRINGIFWRLGGEDEEF